MPRVALVKGEDRYSNIAQALEHIADEVDVRGKERILIKPNFVFTTIPLAATHVQAVRAVLDFLRRRTDARITIAEGAGLGETPDGFRDYGYNDLAKEYRVDLVDLNGSEWIEAPVHDARGKTFPMALAKRVVESDFRISVGPPKTHDTVLVTLSLKNMVMGAVMRSRRAHPSTGPAARAVGALTGKVPTKMKFAVIAQPAVSGIARRLVNNDRRSMHMGYPTINLNLYRLAPCVYPHLSVIDGFVGMEGRGPAYGDAVDLRCAVAGTDFLAADTVGAALMGIDVDDVGYLHYCKVKGLGEGDLSKITIVGDDLAACRRTFRLHPEAEAQRRWRIPNVERLL